MRVLITGAGGQLGHELVAAFDGHEVVAATRSTIDVADRDATVGAIVSVEPDIVVNAAAFTDVDACESDVDRALVVNALGVRHVADGARRVGAHVLHVSTDYVFDGTASTPYNEWDATNPMSVYGRSKLGGEGEIDPGGAIVRTSWLCGAHGRNILKTVLRLAAEPGELRFVDDQHGCPTFAADVAGTIRHLAVARLPGVFHVTNQGATTWFEFARAIVAAAGHDAGRVVPVPSSQLSRPAPRPAYSVLDNAALRLSGIPLLPAWEEPMERLVKELVR